MDFRSAMKLLSLGFAVENEQGTVYWFEENIGTALSFFKCGFNPETNYHTVALVGNEFKQVTNLRQRLQQLASK